MASNFKSALLISTALATLAKADGFYDDEGNLHITMKQNGTFKIVQFTDLHFGESEERDEMT